MKENGTSSIESDTEEVTVDRTILAAYLNDNKGEKTTELSKNITIELNISPTEGSPFIYYTPTDYNLWSDPYILNITKSNTSTLKSDGKIVEALRINPMNTGETTSADMFNMGTFTSTDDITYEYASFVRKNPSETLVVWLHGAGEGGTEGTDPRIALLANEAGKLAEAEFQEVIGGAHILVPQIPTYWMDKDGSAKMFGALESFYTKSLEELIEMYKTENNISEVVLMGCSNGGYMTMVLALENPDAYVAIVPICEALKDEYIPQDKLEGLKNLPMYFIYSEDNTIVDPTVYEIPTIERLRALGATNLQVAPTEHVEDSSGRFEAEDGEPYIYDEHCSWITFFNNEAVTDDGVKAWDWITEQLLQNKV